MKEVRFNLQDKLSDKINCINNESNELQGYDANDIKAWVEALQANGEVIIGYRSSCGSTDKTMRIYRLWVKVAKLLNKHGITLNQEHIKVGNSYATLSGGFWHEIRYFLGN